MLCSLTHKSKKYQEFLENILKEMLRTVFYYFAMGQVFGVYVCCFRCLFKVAYTKP